MTFDPNSGTLYVLGAHVYDFNADRWIFHFATLNTHTGEESVISESYDDGATQILFGP
jgi:hypothetical protein